MMIDAANGIEMNLAVNILNIC